MVGSMLVENVWNIWNYNSYWIFFIYSNIYIHEGILWRVSGISLVLFLPEISHAYPSDPSIIICWFNLSPSMNPFKVCPKILSSKPVAVWILLGIMFAKTLSISTLIPTTLLHVEFVCNFLFFSCLILKFINFRAAIQHFKSWTKWKVINICSSKSKNIWSDILSELKTYELILIVKWIWWNTFYWVYVLSLMYVWSWVKN